MFDLTDLQVYQAAWGPTVANANGQKNVSANGQKNVSARATEILDSLMI